MVELFYNYKLLNFKIHNHDGRLLLGAQNEKSKEYDRKSTKAGYMENMNFSEDKTVSFFKISIEIKH